MRGKRLPAVKRERIRQLYARGKDYVTIARIMGLPRPTVHSVVHPRRHGVAIGQ